MPYIQRNKQNEKKNKKKKEKKFFFFFKFWALEKLAVKFLNKKKKIK